MCKSQNNVVKQFINQAIESKDKIAIEYGNTIMTYEQLHKESDRLCSLLRLAQVAPGNSVPLVVQRTPEFIIGMLAIAKAGAAYIPIDIHNPQKRIAQIIEQSNSPVVLLGNHAFTSHVELAGVPVIAIDKAYPDLARDPCIPTLSSADESAYVIFTSGTTGIPKGVMVSHGALHNLVNWHNVNFAVDAQCRSTLIAGIGFDVAQWEVWSPLICGATLVLPDSEETRLCPDALLRFFALQRLTHAFVPTVFVPDIVNLPQPAELTLRYLFTAGEKLSPVNVSHLDYSLIDYYGPTEATIFTTCNTVICASKNQPPSIGVPIAGAEVFILDKELQPLGVGQPGELFIGGPGLAIGYLNDIEMTRQRFITSPFSPGKRIYRSGDLACWLPGGRVQYLGRLDEQVKIRGNSIELGEIENVLLQHPTVKGAVALVVGEPDREKRILAFVASPHNDAPELQEKLRQHIANALPAYFMPSAIVVLPRLPLTINGKVDKGALLAHEQQRRAERVRPESNFSEREALLAEIWASLLDDVSPGLDDEFTHLGGHSLTAAKMAVVISEKMGVQTYVHDIYDHPTIRLLAKALEERSRTPSVATSTEPLRILQDDIFLPDDIYIDPHFDEYQVTAPRCILLTGSTGFVGSHLLSDLMRTTEAKVYCLIRAQDLQTAQLRLSDTLAHYHIVLTEAQRVRAVPICGDISKPRLGMLVEEYRRLSQEVDIIYHSGGAINFIQPYSYLKHINVQGVREIIRFAAEKRTKPVMLLSSVAVFSWKPQHSERWIMHEDDDIDLNLPEVLTDIGYVRSKWVMEKVAGLAVARGLPMITFRLGYATNHSETGVSAEYQWWGNLVKTCLDCGIVPALQEFREGLTTVDYITSVITYVSRNPQAIGKKFHLTPEPEDSLTLDEFFSLLEQYFGFHFHRQPLPEWFAHWEEDPESPLYPILGLIRENASGGQSTIELYQNTYQWDKRNVKQFLQGSMIQEPQFTRQVLARYLRQSIGYQGENIN
ncbi:amino acid adenylation domain-containing protein [Serratia marcescens]|nr:amino acid adenylation domain-containing protein [Serratia marcescens]